MRRVLFFTAIFVILVAAGAWWWTRETLAPPRDEAVSLLSGAADAGYARALVPRRFEFPADHGPHPDFRQEWWYYTGNLAAADGRHFGYQLTFFRFALAPPSSTRRTSAWAARQVYLAHFALTDVGGKRFYQQERSSRAALGLAGAEAQPFRVWLEDWSVTGAPILPMTLRAATPEVALDLELTSDKPLVLQGEQGLSQKGASPGNASYYYSYTRMPSKGTLRVGNETFAVTGASWMDREWSTSALERDQVGWDWFALQLASGEELMFYQLRRRDGTIDRHSGGVWVDGAGATRPITPDEFHLQVEREWRSPDGARYPSAWHVRVPALRLDLRVQSYLADQEIRQRFRYWEGAVAVQGRRGDDAVSGSGYVELVGYGGGAARR